MEEIEIHDIEIQLAQAFEKIPDNELPKLFKWWKLTLKTPKQVSFYYGMVKAFNADVLSSKQKAAIMQAFLDNELIGFG